MKIATFNVNNINRRLPNLLQWLEAAKPHIVCLQELKCTDDEFPAAAIEGPVIMQFGAAKRLGMASPSCRVMPNPS